MSDKLSWIQFTGGNEDYAIELIFEGDKHHEIRLKKGMTPEQVAGVLLASHCELMSLKVGYDEFYIRECCK